MSVRLDGWGWRHSGRAAWAVSGITLAIEPGERVLLLGASGAGKSTLLHALAGVLGSADEGESAGQLTIDGERPRPGGTGLVMQDPDAQTILARIGDDVAFGLENQSVPRDEIWPRVREALAAVGLDPSTGSGTGSTSSGSGSTGSGIGSTRSGIGSTGSTLRSLSRSRSDRVEGSTPSGDAWLMHSTERLSGGQRQRLALAGALAMRPGLLLLDEPTANLDPEGVEEVRDAVGRLVEDRRTTLVVVEHRIETWLPLVDRVVVLAAGGGVVADGPPERVFARHGAELAAMGAWVPGISHGLVPRTPPGPSAPVLSARDLTIGYEADRPVRTVAAIDVPVAASTTLTGANGSGKTTLALTLAGLLPALSGEVVASSTISPGGRTNPWRWRSRELLTRLGTVFQDPEHQFVSATVADELAIGLRALKRSPAEVSARVAELLDLLHLGRLARANPFTLSGGEKRRLSVGTVLSTNPAVMFLDEPTFGQDRNTWVDLVQLVTAALDAGTTVISVTHDRDYLALLGENRIHLEAPR